MNPLRLFIREILKEQVLGYTPPQKKSDDDSDADFLAYGDMSSPAPEKPSETEDPEDEEQLQTQLQTTNQQRQKDLDSKNASAANYDGRVLQKLQKTTG